MNATGPTPAGSQDDVFVRKAAHLFAVAGPEAARDFAIDIAPIAATGAVVSIASFLAANGATADSQAVLCRVVRTAPDRLDVYETLGKGVKNARPRTGPPAPPAPTRVPAQDCGFTTVMGTSFVRSFASGTRFLPIMLGPASSLSFLTAEATAVTKRVVWNVLRRTDPSSLHLLVFGNGDASAHLRDGFGTWTAAEKGELSHDKAVRDAVLRYLDMVEEIRVRTSLNLALFAAAPAVKTELIWMCDVFNEELHKYSVSTGVPIIDLTDELIDPATRLLKMELRSRADDMHLNHDVVPMIEAHLSALNLLPREGHPFEWEYMFRFSIDPEVESRIWNEPHMGGTNIVNSPRVKLAQVLERAANILIGHIADDAASDVLVLNGREGFVGLEIPVDLAARITSVDTGDGRAVMGGRIARLLGRGDVQFETARRVSEIATRPHDYTMIVMHADDDGEDCLAAITAAIQSARRRVLVLTPQALGERLRALPGVGAVAEINLSNRFITGYWSGVRLFAVARADRA